MPPIGPGSRVIPVRSLAGTVLTTLLLIAVSCGSAEPTATPTLGAVESEPSEQQQDIPASRPSVLPDAVLPTVSGGQIEFGTLEGNDLVLWFWAPW